MRAAADVTLTVEDDEADHGRQDDVRTRIPDHGTGSGSRRVTCAPGSLTTARAPVPAG